MTRNSPAHPFLDWWQVPSVIALIAALIFLNGTRAYDCLRAASYFVRTRRGPAVSIVRLDQQLESTRDRRYDRSFARY